MKFCPPRPKQKAFLLKILIILSSICITDPSRVFLPIGGEGVVFSYISLHCHRLLPVVVNLQLHLKQIHAAVISNIEGDGLVLGHGYVPFHHFHHVRLQLLNVHPGEQVRAALVGNDEGEALLRGGTRSGSGSGLSGGCRGPGQGEDAG